jgi:hypothetical protein
MLLTDNLAPGSQARHPHHPAASLKTQRTSRRLNAMQASPRAMSHWRKSVAVLAHRTPAARGRIMAPQSH